MDPSVGERLTFLNEDEELIEHRLDGAHFLFGADQTDLIAARHHPDRRKEALQGPEMSVTDPQQLEHEVVGRDAHMTFDRFRGHEKCPIGRCGV